MPGKVAFVNVTVTGENGVLESNDDRKLQMTVEGGRLLAFGSANPCTEDRYDAGTCTTYFGHAMAVVCTNQPGELKIRVFGEGLAEASVTIKVE